MSNKRKVGIVTDSTSDIPLHIREELDIEVVPLSVNLEDGSSYLDRVTITPEEFLAKLRDAKELPKTAQPSSAEFREAFDRVLAKDLDILCVNVSSDLSGTYNAATLGAEGIDPERIRIIDTRVTTGQLGLLAMHVARAANTGATLEQLEKLAIDTIPKVDTYAVLSSLDYAYRGGRIGRASHVFGSALGIKPVVNFVDGVLTPMDKVRTWKRALKRCIDLVPTKGTPEEIFVLHADNLEDAEMAHATLQERFPDIPIHLDWVGPTISVYAGPGSIGIMVRVA